MIYTDAPDFARQGDMPEKIRAYCRRTEQKIPERPVEVMQTIIQGLACEYRRHNEQLSDVTGAVSYTHLLAQSTPWRSAGIWLCEAWLMWRNSLEARDR